MSQTGSAAAAASRTIDSTPRKAPFGAPHAFVLVVVDGDDPSGVHRLARTETIVGRGDGVHFLIEDEQVSKTHCKIRVEGPICTIMDLGSRNGTSVNDRRLLPDVAQRLRNLDEIEIGSHRYLLLAGRFRARPKNIPT